MAAILSFSDIALRVLIAFGMSLVFGLERQFKKKPVGFGTFTFVTVGATTLTLMAELVSDTPITIFGAIVTGIGFLGAGAIIKSSDKKVTGITTAASIWAFAALGIIIGLGLYVLAILFYMFIAIIIIMDHYFERHGFGSYSKAVTITVNDPVKIRELDKMLPENHKITTYNFDLSKKEYTVNFYMSGNKREINMTLNEFIKQPGVLKIIIE
jgi:putative Mg2+ transporter-C (MgtC) family protein